MENIKSVVFKPDKLLRSLDLIPICSGIGIRARPWPFGFEPHPFIRVYYLEKGCFDLMFPQKIYQLCSGGIYLIPSSIPFQYIFKEECKHFFIHFSSRSLDHIGIFNHPLELASEDCSEIRELIIDFVKNSFARPESLRENIKRRIQIHHILLPFLEQLNDLHGDQLERKDTLYQVMNDIEQNLDGVIELDKLHKKFAMRRISNACSMLIRSQMTLQEIALSCGYEDLFLFFRMFKKYTKMTPTQFREHYRQI